MNRPQFAERQFETAANNELSRGVASPFVPSQNLEYYLAIDAAHDPRGVSAIWRILSVQIPRRVSISPALWPALPRHFHDEIPGRYVSLFLQYKAPVHQDNRRAKYYARIGSSYFQVTITGHQQTRLRALERRVAALAVTRYASPAFWSRADFDHHDTRRQVLAHSAFVAPSIVKTHRTWLYAGPGTAAFLNPELEESDGEAWENLVNVLGAMAQRQSLREHIQNLATALTDEEGTTQTFGNAGWLDRLQQYGQFEANDLQLLLNISNVALAADAADLVWIILLAPDPEWVALTSDTGLEWHRWWRFGW